MSLDTETLDLVLTTLKSFTNRQLPLSRRLALASASWALNHTNTSHSAESAARARSLDSRRRSTRAPSPLVPSFTQTGVVRVLVDPAVSITR